MIKLSARHSISGKKTLIGRVAFVLLYFTKEIYNSRVFDLPVSRKEIADYIGMSTANVIRTLSDFKKEGIIRVFGKTIEVVDIEKLEVISKTRLIHGITAIH